VSLEVLASGCLGSLIGQTNTVASMTMGTVDPRMVAALDMAEALVMGMGMDMDEGDEVDDQT
jgi:hypothetical protein